MGWAGLAVLLGLGQALDLGTKLPGYLALLPVGAALALIVSSWVKVEPKPLTWAPTLKIADASFSIYLWHWPLLVFYRYHFGAQVSLVGGLGIIGASIALALLTTHLVENPIRFSRLLRRSAGATLLVSALLLTIPAVMLLWWGALERTAHIEAWEQGRDTANDRPASAVTWQDMYPGPQSGISPEPAYPNVDKHLGFKGGCITATKGSELKKCRWTHGNSSRRVAVVGGSRTAQWLDVILDQQQWFDAEVYTMSKSSCPFGDTEGFGYTPPSVCTEWNEAVMEELLADPPDLVVTNGTRWIDGINIIPEGFQTAFQTLLDAGISVVAIEDNPLFPENVPECVATRGAENCFQDYDKYYSENHLLEPMDHPRFHFVGMADQYCPDGVCVSVDNGVLVYQDSHHLTKLWTRVYGEPVVEAIKDALETH